MAKAGNPGFQIPNRNNLEAEGKINEEMKK
jgi:hypothetical protein